MKRLFSNLIILTILILNCNISYAAHGGSHAATGNADVYKVTMRKIELCEGYTVVAVSYTHLTLPTSDLV